MAAIARQILRRNADARSNTTGSTGGISATGFPASISRAARSARRASAVDFFGN
jgi:hypothetical protein